MEMPVFDLKGRICPFPVTFIISKVSKLHPGGKMLFIVDDPLAIKSVPTELEDIQDISIDIQKVSNEGWHLIVEKTGG